MYDLYIYLSIWHYSSTKTADADTEAGISPRAVRELLRVIKEDLTSEWVYKCSFSMLEIYNETIRDLLIPGGSGPGSGQNKLEVRQTSEGNIVTGLTGKCGYNLVYIVWDVYPFIVLYSV